MSQNTVKPTWAAYGARALMLSKRFKALGPTYAKLADELLTSSSRAYMRALFSKPPTRIQRIINAGWLSMVSWYACLAERDETRRRAAQARETQVISRTVVSGDCPRCLDTRYGGETCAEPECPMASTSEDRS